MSETVTTEQATQQAATQVPEPTSATESAPATKPAQDTTPRPRIPRPHCAC